MKRISAIITAKRQLAAAVVVGLATATAITDRWREQQGGGWGDRRPEREPGGLERDRVGQHDDRRPHP